MFVKELQLYLSYLSNKIDEIQGVPSKKQQKYLNAFSKNLQDLIDYYRSFTEQVKDMYKEGFERIEEELSRQNADMNKLQQRLALLPLS